MRKMTWQPGGVGGAFLLFLARLIEKGCFLLVVLLISRMFPVADYGKFSFAVYGSFIVAVVAEFGLQTILTTQLMANPQRQGELFGVALILRLPLSFAALVILGAINLVGDFEREQAQLVWVIGVGQVAMVAGYLANAVFRAAGRLDLEGAATVGRGLLYVVALMLALLMRLPLQRVGWALFLAHGVGMLLSIGLASRVIRPKRSRSIMADSFLLLTEATPLAFSLVATALFGVLSVFVLRLLVADTLVGWYNSAHALVSQFLFIPEVVMALQLPLMMAGLQRKRTDGRPLTESLLVMVAIGLPSALAVSLLAPQLLALVFGDDFTPAAGALRWLTWSLPCSFINLAYMMFFTARKQQGLWLLFVLGGIAVTGLALFTLLPIFGMEGAAMARLAGEVALCCFSTIAARRFVDRDRIAYGVIRIAMATLGLVAAGLLTRAVPLFLAVAVGTMVYLLSIGLFGPWPLRLWRPAGGV